MFRARIVAAGTAMVGRSGSARIFAVALFAVACSSASATESDFSHSFTGSALRLVFYHAGTTTREQFSLRSVHDDGTWAGSQTVMVDPLKRGDYLIVVSEPATHLVLYTRGFESDLDKSASWSATLVVVRVPTPRSSVRLTIKERRSNGYAAVWSGTLDPNDKMIDRSQGPGDATVTVLEEHGPASVNIDVAILGDGYRAEEKDKFLADARRAAGYLFAVSPYREARGSFNLRAVFLPSRSSGITNPLEGRWVDSAFGAFYNNHNVERSLGIRNIDALYAAAALVPHDFILVLANSVRYGGSGGYSRYCVVAIDSEWAPYLTVHEFSHTFAGLDDEYFTLAPCTPGRHAEPWQPNSAAMSRPEGLKWRSLVTPRTPIPTPWPSASTKQGIARSPTAILHCDSEELRRRK